MEIQEIKQRLTLANVLQHYHLKPDKNHRLHCPFHEDKTPRCLKFSYSVTWDGK